MRWWGSPLAAALMLCLGVLAMVFCVLPVLGALLFLIGVVSLLHRAGSTPAQNRPSLRRQPPNEPASLHTPGLRAQPVDVLLRSDDRLRPGLQALPGVGEENPHPEELSTAAAKALLDQAAAFPRPPNVVLTGGDPLKRADLLELIRHAVGRGLHVALTPSATPLATRQAFQQVREAGVRTLGISLDGADAATHDAFRGWEGSYRRAMHMLADARQLDPPSRSTRLLPGATSIRSIAWPSCSPGRALPCGRSSFWCRWAAAWKKSGFRPEEYELVFARLWHHAGRQPYAVKTTEAPHYRRFVLQHGGNPLAGPGGAGGGRPGHGHRGPLGVGDGKGVMFVSHVGEFFPAGFLPLCCGRFPPIRSSRCIRTSPRFAPRRSGQFSRESAAFASIRSRYCGGQPGEGLCRRPAIHVGGAGLRSTSRKVTAGLPNFWLPLS